MNVRTWPARDQTWATRYRTAMIAGHVPAHSLEERERELIDAVHETERSAAELFGDAHALATEDAAELSTADEAVRTSLGGGLRPALREVGGTLTGIGVTTAVLTVLRHGWSVDIDFASTLVAFSVLVVFLGWIVTRAFFSAGRTASALGALIAAAGTAAAGLVATVSIGPGVVAVSDAPVALLAPVLLAPGITMLVIAARRPRQELREEWDDDEWLRRFRGGLRARLMPAVTARGHVAEIEQSLATGAASAYEEFGHPLALARELAAADRTARARRWWVSVATGTGTSLALAVLIATHRTWGSASVAIAVTLVLVGTMNFLVRWSDRPQGAR